MMKTATQNPFPKPTALEKVLLRELVRCAKSCYDRGWSWGTAGNFSLRGQNGIIWQSPTGLNKGALDPTLFIPVELATMQLVTPEKLRPSQEMPVHIGIFRAVPEAMAVVHTHSPNLVALSRSGKPIEFQGDEMQKHLGSKDHLEKCVIPVVKNPTPQEMPALADGIAPFIDRKVQMVVLATHGVYAWGKTPMEALSYIEAAEFLCQTRR